MDKQKIIKISMGGVIIICAIIYYFSNNEGSNEYENILEETAVVENNIIPEKIEEKESKIKVYVTGEVKAPGVIELKEGDRIEDAVNTAGGITGNANLKDINLAYEVSDGEKIYIPNINEIQNEESVSEASFTNNTSSQKGKININKATVSDLTKIPGVGASTAAKIIAYRDENGKFSSIDDIKKVSGIGNNKFENIKEYISTK